MTEKRPPQAGSGAPEGAGTDALEAAFAATRAEGDALAPLPPGLAARILADAAAEAAPAPADCTGPANDPRPGLRAWLDRRFPLRVFFPGIAAATAGLTACALGGIWLGYAPPASLETLPAALSSGLGLTVDAGTTGGATDLLVPLDFGEISDV